MSVSLRLESRFFKGHGHGNDYLVFAEGVSWPVAPETVQLVCHRQRGVGADGIVVLLATGRDGEAASGGPGGDRRAPFELRMFNPDGSEFERSGNGLRILAAYLHSVGKVGIGHPFPVEVGGEIVTMEVMGRGVGGILDVSVDMGPVSFGPTAVGAEAAAFVRTDAPSDGPEGRHGWTLPGPDGVPLPVFPTSVGNPHCVVFRADLLESDFQELGPFLTRNPAFPDGTNVQVGRVLSSRELQILIWERGVGRTSSSGTSACAAAAAGVRAGLLTPGPIQVDMEGGSFEVTVSPTMSASLRGPVQPLVWGELSEGFLSALRS